MSGKRIYNMVLKATDVCPQGELLTDKELERINLTRMPKDERNKLLKQFNIPE